ncbi:MAG: class I adenylate-forming enzyme family protein, partial [Mycobacteriales bacterium]
MQLGYLPWVLAERHGDRPAVADDARALSFEGLDRRTEAFADQLRSLGFGAGDVLGIMLRNRVELLVAVFAAWRLGGVATPVNPAFTQSEAQHQLSDSRALAVLHEGQLEPQGAAGLHVDAMATVASEPVRPVHLNESDLALLIYTSGSTGRPKGVMLSHSNADAMSSTMVSHFGLTSEDHCLLVLPLFHVNALMVSVLAPLRVGGRVSIVGGFSARRFFGDVERLRPTYFSAVPTIYSLLVSQPPDQIRDTSSLRFVVCGAAPVSRELLDACEQRLGFTMVEGYGLTEGTCASACNPVDGVRKLGTVGPALPGQRIAIADPDGVHLPVGEPGEVLIAGPTVMQGYFGNEEATRAAIVDGWLHTGDVGVLDEDGYLSIVDRIKDMILRGGENIYPKELESTLAQVDGVLDVAVVGRADALLGEVPVAFVVLYPEAQVTEHDLLQHCRQHLARVKVPVDI